jgi:superfamily II DNA helicase RecQ
MPGRAPAGDRDRPPDAPHEGVVGALRAWRSEEARRRAVPPFVILHDRTLFAIAASLPGSVEELGSVPGIGARKIDVYGDAILAAVASAAAGNTRYSLP